MDKLDIFLIQEFLLQVLAVNPICLVILDYTSDMLLCSGYEIKSQIRTQALEKRYNDYPGRHHGLIPLLPVRDGFISCVKTLKKDYVLCELKPILFGLDHCYHDSSSSSSSIFYIQCSLTETIRFIPQRNCDSETTNHFAVFVTPKLEVSSSDFRILLYIWQDDNQGWIRKDLTLEEKYKPYISYPYPAFLEAVHFPDNNIFVLRHALGYRPYLVFRYDNQGNIDTILTAKIPVGELFQRFCSCKGNKVEKHLILAGTVGFGKNKEDSKEDCIWFDASKGEFIEGQARDFFLSVCKCWQNRVENPYVLGTVKQGWWITRWNWEYKWRIPNKYFHELGLFDEQESDIDKDNNDDYESLIDYIRIKVSGKAKYLAICWIKKDLEVRILMLGKR